MQPAIHRIKERFALLKQRILSVGQMTGQSTEDILFDGSDKLFKEAALSCRVYGEYGSGRSTLWIARHTNAAIYSVDSSNEWTSHINGQIASLQLSDIERRVKWINLGKTMDWGTPAGYSKKENFPDYFKEPWSNARSPDMVLVDGRFRVACFLTSLIHSPPGTKIFFDDYTKREQYWIVEEYCAVNATCGRQALFITPTTIDRAAAQEAATSFYNVMD